MGYELWRFGQEAAWTEQLTKPSKHLVDFTPLSFSNGLPGSNVLQKAGVGVVIERE